MYTHYRGDIEVDHQTMQVNHKTKQYRRIFCSSKTKPNLFFSTYTAATRILGLTQWCEINLARIYVGGVVFEFYRPRPKKRHHPYVWSSVESARARSFWWYLRTSNLLVRRSIITYHHAIYSYFSSSSSLSDNKWGWVFTHRYRNDRNSTKKITRLSSTRNSKVRSMMHGRRVLHTLFPKPFLIYIRWITIGHVDILVIGRW